METLVRDFIINFTSILYEAMPFIILGSVIAGILEEMVPQQLIAKIVPSNRFLAIIMSALLGLVFPMCECGIVPVMRRLLRKGLPLGCCTAYLLAGPIINPVVILSTFVAFKPHDNGMVIVIGRIVGGFVVAVITSLIVESLYRREGNSLLTKLAQPPSPPPSGSRSLTVVEDEGNNNGNSKRPFSERLNNIAETALHDFVDITVFLIMGALLAATTRMILSHERIEQLSYGYPVLSILLMMGLAIVLCLCSEADAFVAASFTQMQPAAKLAFLVLGPMLDFKLYFLYTRVFRPKLIFTIFGSVVVQVLIYSLLFHFFGAPLLKLTPVTAG